MGPTIDCCTDNVSGELYDDLQQTNAEITRQYCLQRCWCCHDRSFVVVNGDVVVGDNKSALRDELEARDLLGGDSA